MGADPMLDAVMSTAASMEAAQDQETPPEAGEGPPGEGEEDVADNGTNPASMSFKFMPYYRYTELENGIKAGENITLFTLLPLPLTPFTALVLEWPVMYSMDFGSLAVDLVKEIEGGLPEEGVRIPCGPPTCAAPRPLPIEGIVRGFDITGNADFRFRLLQGLKMFEHGEGSSTVLMAGIDLMAPAASDPVLGDQTWYGSPILAHIHNFNPTTFAAFLHFYFSDWAQHKDFERADIGFYMGRYFFQKAWPSSGYYMLPELQIIYDNKSDADWSVMFLPEVGKTWRSGETVVTGYIKPGWTFTSPDPFERRFSVEFGMRFIPGG